MINLNKRIIIITMIKNFKKIEIKEERELEKRKLLL